jgi:hypothetical protein
MPRRVPVLILLIAAACDSSAGDAPASGNAAPSLARQRLENGARALDAIVRERPDDSVGALASFTGERDIDEVVAHARRLGLTITGFRHGSRTHSGGYTLSPGESVEDAVAAYRRDLDWFPRRRAERMRRLAAETTDPDLSRSLAEHASELEARVDALNATGRVKVIGFELSGPAILVDEFRRTVSFVRGVELRSGSRHDAAISPFTE